MQKFKLCKTTMNRGNVCGLPPGHEGDHQLLISMDRRPPTGPRGQIAEPPLDPENPASKRPRSLAGLRQVTLQNAETRSSLKGAT